MKTLKQVLEEYSYTEIILRTGKLKTSQIYVPIACGMTGQARTGMKIHKEGVMHALSNLLDGNVSVYRYQPLTDWIEKHPSRRIHIHRDYVDREYHAFDRTDTILEIYLSAMGEDNAIQDAVNELKGLSN